MAGPSPEKLEIYWSLALLQRSTPRFVEIVARRWEQDNIAGNINIRNLASESRS